MTAIALSKQFLAPYYAKKDNFPGLLSRIVFKGHYSRDGESWTDTIKRTVEGNVNECGGVSLQEAEKLFDVMWKGYALPPGRGLWTGGVPNMPVGARYNCWACELRSVDDLCWAMTQLMLGGGVGVSLAPIDKINAVRMTPCNLTITCDPNHADYSKVMKYGSGLNELGGARSECRVIQVKDSREGWVECFREVVMSAFLGSSIIVDVSKVRPFGATLKTFGGIASGPVSLCQLLVNVWNIVRGARGRQLRSVEWTDVIDWIGVCVQSGNVRRSAIIVLGDPNDSYFRKAKQDRAAVESHRWASNNSIMFTDENQFDDFDWLSLVEDNRDFGDPGFLNLWRGRQNDPGVVAVNPCGEQLLHHREACNLAEVFPGNWRDIVVGTEVIRLMIRYCLRQRLAPLPDKTSDETRRMNMRVGLGMGGLCDFEWNEQLLRSYYRAAREEADSYADELGVAHPITVTTVKPSGSISLLTGSNPGIHSPKGEYIIRRIRFNVGDPMIEVLKSAGVHCEPDVYSPNGRVVFAFPIRCRIASHAKVSSLETVEDQINRQLAVQRSWVDNATSITVEYGDGEEEQLANMLKKHVREMKSCSFLRKENMYQQAPLEVIDSDTYLQMASKIDENRALDEHHTELELETCEGGACGIDRVSI